MSDLKAENEALRDQVARWKRAWFAHECLPCNICGDWNEVDDALIDEEREAIDDLHRHGDIPPVEAPA